MHPSMLYEIVFQLAMFGVLWRLRGRLRTEGDLLKLYLLSYAVFRFAVEFVRGSPVVFAGLTRPQLFLLPTTVVGAAYLARRRSQAPAPVPVQAA